MKPICGFYNNNNNNDESLKTTGECNATRKDIQALLQQDMYVCLCLRMPLPSFFPGTSLNLDSEFQW